MMRCSHTVSLAEKLLLLRAPGSCRMFSAGEMRLDFGKHRGLTFEECQRKHPDYGDWILKQERNPKTEAFREFVDKAKSSSRDAAPPRQHGNVSGPGNAAQSSSALAHSQSAGGDTISFGRYRGKSFEDVCKEDAHYCHWVVQSAKKPEASADIRSFAAFVQDRFPEIAASSPPAPTTANVSRVSDDGRSRSGVVKQHREFMPKGDAVCGGLQGQEGWKGQSNRPYNQSKWTPQRKIPDDNETVSSGKKLLGGGKHADLTYAEAFEREPQYCRYMVEWGISECTTRSGWHWPFLAYVLHRELIGDSRVSETLQVTAQKSCLKGISVAISGEPEDMPRHALEELINFFGGKVVTTVTAKTTYLILGRKSPGGRPVEAGAKYTKARQLDLPCITVRELMEDLRGTAEDGEQDTFVFGAYAQLGEHAHSE